MALPTLSATVSRNANDRRMEFTMPAGGRVVFLDKGGTNYLILPDKKQYAELTSESLGFEIRRMMMPEQIVAQAMKVPGMQLVGKKIPGTRCGQISLCGRRQYGNPGGAGIDRFISFGR
jgi:hypothetical protein